MSPEHAVLSIAIFAAFADGNNKDQEREQIRQITETLGADLPDMSRIYQAVLLNRVMLSEVTAAIADLSQRQFAYEMAVCVCNADGRLCDAERRFLQELKRQLGLQEDQQSQLAEEQADCMMDIDIPSAAEVRDQAAITLNSADYGQPAKPLHKEAAINSSILNYAILNGALEILPQSWASMAIIPLQIKMVYSIGTAHGHELDRGHIKEFLATAGVGLTSQYVEQIGRKLLGGLLGKLAGKGIGKIGNMTTGMAFSFATTYALGHLAKDYYAGGRQMTTASLRHSFQNLLEPAKQLQRRYLPQIQQKAASLDGGQIMAMIRGQALGNL
jgi:uncharacterized protein (DUF697 family)/tellurite resistance protein